MKDLGKKRKELYGGETVKDQKNEIIYSEIDLPLSLIEGMNIKVDDNVDLHIKGRVSGMLDTKWAQRVTVEAHQGDIKKKSNTDGKSVLETA